MTKYLAIVFLITGFLVGDAYGEEDTAKSVKKIMEELERLRKLPPPVPEDLPWSEQKAKEFGFPAVAVGTTTMCEGMKSVGFNWEKGEYISKNFKVGKELYKKVEPDKYCLGWKRLTAEEKLGFIKK